MSVLECLTRVVGLTDKQCACLGDPENEDNVSLSGKYLTDADYGVNIMLGASVADCGDGSSYDQLVKSRKDGINEFITHFGTATEDSKNIVLSSTRGNIGENEGTYPEATGLFHAVRLTPKVWKGASLFISEIDLYIDIEQEYTIQIINADEGNVVTAQTMTAGNGNKTTFSFNVKLPLSDSRGEKITYIYGYETKGGKPTNHDLTCGCSGRVFPWKNFFDGTGVHGSDMDTLRLEGSKTKRTGGMKVFYSLNCDPVGWMCDVPDSFWIDSNFGRVAALCIQLYSSINIINRVLKSDKVNYYSTLKREDLYGLRNKYTKLVTDTVHFLAKRMPEDMSHCYQCSSSMGFEVHNIMQ